MSLRRRHLLGILRHQIEIANLLLSTYINEPLWKDIIINGPCKQFLRKQYINWQFQEISRRRSDGVIGKLVVKINRELLMIWTEKFVDYLNYKEGSGITNMIIPCLSKVGQNCFDSDTKSFTAWLNSLDKNALYKSLLRAHTAMKL